MDGGARLHTIWLQRVGHDWVTPLSNVFLGFPPGSDDKESACNAGDPGEDWRELLTSHTYDSTKGNRMKLQHFGLYEPTCSWLQSFSSD